MFPVAAITGAGWLVLFVVLLMAPPSPGPHEGGGPGKGPGAGGARRRWGGLDAWGDPGGGQAPGPQAPGPQAPGPQAPGPQTPGDEPPAVIGLLAGRLDKTGFGATLADLAARGWFEVRAPGGQAGPGSWGPAGPAMCVVPARAPSGELTPFERRVVAHVALRAGARGEVPAPALSDGFGGGESEFMSAFRGEVDAEARRRGLTRPWLSGRRIALLCLTLLIPAVAVLVAGAVTHERAALFYAAGLYVVGCGVAIGVGTSRRNSAAGRAALDRWRSVVAAAPSGGGRLPAYAAALGGAPAALAVFGQGGGGGGGNVAWSSYRGGWQQIEIESNTWSWPKGCAIAVAIGLGPIAFFAAILWLAFNGMGAIAWELVGLTAAGAVAGTLVWLARRKVFPADGTPSGQRRLPRRGRNR